MDEFIAITTSKAPADRESEAYKVFIQAVKDRIAPSDHKTFPFVWINGVFVGGFTELKQSLERCPA